MELLSLLPMKPQERALVSVGILSPHYGLRDEVLQVAKSYVLCSRWLALPEPWKRHCCILECGVRGVLCGA